MKVGDAAFGGDQQAPPDQGADATEHDPQLVDHRRRRCTGFWHAAIFGATDPGLPRFFPVSNIQESGHQLARRIFHGQRNELRQRYREGQEDQLGALGLVLNAVVLWNTRYMDLALAQLRRLGVQVLEDDVARLSPLGFRHVNFLGRYAFARLDPGRLRPLRDPADADDEDDEAVV